MIAKLIVHGVDRAEAVAKLRTALAEYRIVGVSSNVEFLARLTSAPSFAEAGSTLRSSSANARICSPQRCRRRSRSGDWRPRLRCCPADPTARLGGRSTAGASAACVNPGGYACATAKKSASSPYRCPREDAEGAYLVPDGDAMHVFEAGAHHVFHVVDPYLPPAESADHHGGLTAPMPGRVLAVMVSPGQEVARGAPLVVMEAMKMEHTVTAPRAGVIDKLFCSVGEQIKEGTELLILK